MPIKCSVLILMYKHTTRGRKYSELKGKMSYWDSCLIPLLKISEKGGSRRNQWYLAHNKAKFLSP